jgi:hypothetical protein
MALLVSQERLEQKFRALTAGDMAKPVVAVSFNVARFDGYNLAPLAPRRLHERVLVPRRQRGVGGGWQAGGRGATGRLVIALDASLPPSNSRLTERAFDLVPAQHRPPPLSSAA